MFKNILFGTPIHKFLKMTNEVAVLSSLLTLYLDMYFPALFANLL